MTARPPDRRVAALLLAGLLALSGCTEDEPNAPTRTSGPTTTTTAAAPQTSPAPALTTIKVPAALRSTRPVTTGLQAIPGLGSAQPDLVTTTSLRDGKVRVELRPGAAPARVTPIPVEGAVTAFAGAGPAGTVVVGDRRVGGRSVPYSVWSTDRRTWRTTAVDTAGTALRLGPVAVGERLVAVTAATVDGVGHIGVAALGAPLTFVPLPRAAGRVRAPSAVAVHGDRVVVFRTAGAEGVPGRATASTSSDRGRTWSAFRPVQSTDATVVGATWAGTEFVATGTAVRRAGDEPSGIVWRSANGVTWAIEKLWEPAADGVARHPSAPLVAGGRVTVATTCDSCDVIHIQTRTGRTWDKVAGVTQPDGLDPVGVAWTTGPQGVAVTLENGGLMRFTGPAPFTATRITAPTTLPVVGDLLDVRGQTLAVAATLTFTRKAGFGWNLSQRAVQLRLSADTLSLGGWQPAGLGRLTDLHTATDDRSGATLVLGTAADPQAGTWRVRGFLRMSAAAGWTPVALPTKGDYQALGAVTRTPQGWLVATQEATTSSYMDSDFRKVVFHTSSDGRTWRVAPQESRSADVWGSAVADVCSDADGLLAVGASRLDHVRWVATTWRPSATGWVRRDAATPAGQSSYANSCRAAGGKALVSGSSGGSSTVWEATPSGFAPPTTLPEGTTREDEQPLGRGAAAAGALRSDGRDGPVLWWAADARTWVPVPVPTRDPDAWLSLHTAAGATVLVANGPTGVQAWTVTPPPGS